MRRFFINAFFIFQMLAVAFDLLNLILEYKGVSENILILFAFPHVVLLLLLIPFLVSALTSRVPATIFASIIAVESLPFLFHGYYDARYEFIMVFAQLVATIYIFILRLKFTEDRWGLFSLEYFERNKSSSKRIILSITAVTFLTIGALATVGFIALQKKLEREGQGYSRLKWDGFYTDTLVYSNGKTTVYLIGMTHFGDDKFYKMALRQIPEHGSVVLLEGVKDSSGAVNQVIDHKSTAATLGASEQAEKFTEQVKGSREYVNADLNLEYASQEAREYFVLKRKIRGEAKFSSFFEDAEGNKLKHLEAIFSKERGDRAFAIFDLKVGKYKNIILPWGVDHLADFSRRLQDRGYKLGKKFESKTLSFF